MSIINKKYKFYYPSLFIGLCYAYTILFPADLINIKELLLAFVFCITSPVIFEFLLNNKNNIYLFGFGILYPFITTIVSITVGDSNLYDALSFGYVWTFLLLIPSILKYKIDILQVFISITFIVASIINFIYIMDYCNIISIFSNPLVLFLDSMNEIQYGKGVVATFGYSIFYKPAPLLIISFGYMLWKEKWAYAFFFFFALLASGTRANLFASLILMLILMYIRKNNKYYKMAFCAILSILIVCAVPVFVEKMLELQNLKETSDNVKYEHIKSILIYLNEEPIRYLVGSGVGSFFYSTGFGRFTNVVEVSYLDYFRQVGIIGFTFFLYFLMRPLKFLLKNKVWLFYSYIAYLAIAFTNPLLISSTSFMVYTIVYAEMYKNNKDVQII